MKVIVGDSPGKIVLKSIGEVKTIESAGDQRIQVSAPECLVVVPGLIFHFAAEVSAYAAHLICRFLLEDLLQVQSCQGLRAEAHSLGEFEQSVDKAAYISGGYQNSSDWPHFPRR